MRAVFLSVLILWGVTLGGSQLAFQRGIHRAISDLRERVAALETRMTALESKLHGFMAGFKAKEA